MLESIPHSSSERTPRTMAEAEERSSKQPWFPQLQRSPFTSIVVCPSSPASPFLPMYTRQSMNMAEPIPHPTLTNKKSCNPFAWRMAKVGGLLGQHSTETTHFIAGRSGRVAGPLAAGLKNRVSRGGSAVQGCVTSLPPANGAVASARRSQANRIKSAWRTLPGRVCPYLSSAENSGL